MWEIVVKIQKASSFAKMAFRYFKDLLTDLAVSPFSNLIGNGEPQPLGPARLWLGNIPGYSHRPAREEAERAIPSRPAREAHHRKCPRLRPAVCMDEVHRMERDLRSVFLFLVSVVLRPSFDFTGDLVGLNVLGTRILVLNSQKAINDLLDKRGNIYSDRPVFTAVGELMGLNRVRTHTPRRILYLSRHFRSPWR